MSSKKNQLSKLMKLNNPQADRYLVSFASELKTEIEASNDNESTLESLELLESFIHKIPRIALQTIDFVLSQPLPSALLNTSLGDLEGKRHEDVVLKCIDLLGHIRYLEQEEVMTRLAPLVVSSDDTLRNRAQGVLRRLAKLDPHILTQIGYQSQVRALAFIQRWPESERVNNFDFVLLVATELLSTSVEGTSWESPETITFRFGAVTPTDQLRRIRTETIDLVSRLYSVISDSSKQIRLVKVIAEAVRTPLNAQYGDDLLGMVIEDGHLVVDTYRKMLFGEHDELVGNVAVAQEIDSQLSWLCAEEYFRSTGAAELRDDISKNALYDLFRLLVNSFSSADDIPWEEAEAKRTEAIDRRIGEIHDSNLGKWDEDLNLVAYQARIVSRSQFGHFDTFLLRLAERKPELANTLLNDAITENKPLANFAAAVLEGLRDAGQISLWDQTVTEIAKTGDPMLLSAVAYSLTSNTEIDLEQVVRERDLTIIEDIVMEQNDFASQGKDSSENAGLRHAVTTALVRIFRRDPLRIERLILHELMQHPELASIHLRALWIGLLRGWVEYAEFGPDGVGFLKHWLVELDDLNREAQNVLLSLGKIDLDIILDVFWRRIENQESRPSSLLSPRRYEAIPYRLDHRLVAQIKEHRDLPTRILERLEGLSAKWSVRNFEIGRLLHQLGESADQVLISLVERGDDESLAKAVQLMNRFSGRVNIGLLMEVVRRTDSEEILDEVAAMLYSTGVVSGEFGMAEAFEARKASLGRYLEDPSERVRRYTEQMITSFEQSAERERRRVEEDRQLRKIEFEG